jgi:hypothetical protein
MLVLWALLFTSSHVLAKVILAVECVFLFGRSWACNVEDRVGWEDVALLGVDPVYIYKRGKIAQALDKALCGLERHLVWTVFTHKSHTGRMLMRMGP